jgi:GalNAc-alpha-(1->4)-GalNAc-alpha-(1->3)-diNAcBac-PP-undecaprenol alpha-1,4-N-acetyl-D-galactosaminyltransferase
MKKAEICLLIPTLQAGGMERVMSELTNYFAVRQDHQVHLVLYGIKREIFYPVSDRVVIHRPPFTFHNRRRFFYTLRTLFFLRKKVKRINPDVVLSFGEYWNSFVLLSLYGLKLSIYVSDRCQPDKNLGFLHNLLRKVLYPTAKGVIAQTETAKEIYHKLYRHNNIKVIANPIRGIKINTSVVKENIILSVGRLIKTTNPDELINMFARINNPDWKLVIIGDDAIKQHNSEQLKLLIRKLKLEKQVILAGQQSDIDHFYLKSRIFAFTSSSEGFPNVIGEAQSAGLPVIAFDCVAGPSDLIEDGVNGYLIPLFNFAMFEKRLCYLMNDQELRTQLGNKAKETVQQFSITSIGQMFYNFILN